jgi:hypothetical protein
MLEQFLNYWLGPNITQVVTIFTVFFLIAVFLVHMVKAAVK